MMQQRGESVRSAMRLANANAMLWAMGNGLVSTTLVIYLAQHLGARGIEVSLILAAPRFVGLLRLASPAFIRNGRARKAVCLGGYLSSGVVLLMLPALAVPDSPLYTSAGMTMLVTCWCVYHLLEYMATIALWSWLGDWMPPPLRGRLIGWRERYLVIGRIVGIGASVALNRAWLTYAPDVERWAPLALSAVLGSLMLLLAVAPLCWLPAIEPAHPRRSVSSWRQLATALVDPAYRRLLMYSCWLAFANGVTGAANYLYGARVLGIEYNQMVGLRSMMYAGQTALAPAAGRWIDHHGTRWLLTGAQLVVATGPLFYLLASPAQPWWVAGAFVVWMAYAGVNVSLDTLKLKLSPTRTTGPPLAVYHALSDLVSGATLVAAGTFYDTLSSVDSSALWLFSSLFVAGWCLRSLAAALAWRIPESE